MNGEPGTAGQPGQQPAQQPGRVRRVVGGIRAAGQQVGADVGGLARGNISFRQFGNSATGRALQHSLDTYQVSRYMRTAGMGQALRYAIGAPSLSADLSRRYRDTAMMKLATPHNGMAGSSRDPGSLVAHEEPGTFTDPDAE
jgi:hypothetical protein